MSLGDELRAARRGKGWSYSRLVAAIRDQARRDGVRIMSDRSLTTAISRWENNRNKPDRLYMTLLAAVLGLPDADDVLVRSARYERDIDQAVNFLELLSRLDNGENDLGNSAAQLVDADRVITGYLFARSYAVDGDRHLTDRKGSHGDSVAERIRSTASTLMSVDFALGGGHVRETLITYFHANVIPELRSASADMRGDVYAAAAEVAQLLGWSAYDAGSHAVAARYFSLGLRLADEAHDQMLGARLLANLSHQSNFIGNHSQALEFARAAQAALRGRGAPKVETMCVMMEARALASLGDRRGASAAVIHAERVFERRSVDEPEWIGYYDAAELAGDIAHAFRDLAAPSEAGEFARAALTPTTPRRTRAFIQLVAAEVALAAGDLDQAAHLATSALHSGDGLSSHRYVNYLQKFTGSVPHIDEPELAEFVDLLATRHPQFIAPRKIS
ncbi:helix-turn-helix domain-containing protein [Nocardia cyriacigeorgica]|uniref:helix-turn-helix domain-containing protein n=2 Tax=Nocardia cyriacigeorgica TaxID=135487 RepID=UPI0018945575|nr:helix-turn-helix transcriptional regulator [Nocardia cyriacigeorgica]